MVSLALNVASLIATVVIVNLFYHDPTKRVPDWLNNIVLKGIATILRFPSGRRKIDTDPGIILKLEYATSNVSCDSATTTDKTKMMEGPLVTRMPGGWPEEKEDFEGMVKKNKAEWARVSRILDRLCLLLIFIAIVVLTLLLIIGIHS